MNLYLQKYFALHKMLVLPGIGSFAVETKPAELDFVNRTLHSPANKILFTQNENAEDNRLILFLSKESGLYESDIVIRFNQFMEQVISSLQNGTPFHIAGLGTLVKNDNGYSFDAGDATVNDLYPDIIAEKVIRQNAQHSIRVGEDQKTSAEMHEILHKEVKEERWWIAAVVLGVIGVAAILYHYLSRQ